jgi:pimeloyl-ACP methyl ester carboxylesterase
MYRQDPTDILGLVLIEASRLAADNTERDHLAHRVRSVGGKRLLRLNYPDMFLPNADPARVAYCLERVDALDADFIEQIILSTIDWDATYMSETLQGLTVPLLVLQSTVVDSSLRRQPLLNEDESPWICFARTYAADIQVEVIAGSSHFPHVDQPVAVNAAMARFIERLVPTQS